jgi:hypothetical protein
MAKPKNNESKKAASKVKLSLEQAKNLLISLSINGRSKNKYS